VGDEDIPLHTQAKMPAEDILKSTDNRVLRSCSF
jgi:hypothetical protein